MVGVSSPLLKTQTGQPAMEASTAGWPDLNCKDPCYGVLVALLRSMIVVSGFI